MISIIDNSSDQIIAQFNELFWMSVKGNNNDFDSICEGLYVLECKICNNYHIQVAYQFSPNSFNKKYSFEYWTGLITHNMTNHHIAYCDFNIECRAGAGPTIKASRLLEKAFYYRERLHEDKRILEKGEKLEMSYTGTDRHAIY